MQFGDTWTKEQAALVDVVFFALAQHQQWPVFQYVASELSRRGVPDAGAVLQSFPDYGARSHTTQSYCDVQFDHTQPNPPADSKVSLSLSGLNRHQHGDDMARAFVAVLTYAAQKYQSTTMDPTKVVDVEVTSEELSSRRAHFWPDYLVHAAGLLLNSEWPSGVQYMGGRLDGAAWTIQVDSRVLRYLDATVDSYIDSVKQEIDFAAAEMATRYGSPTQPTGGTVATDLPNAIDPTGDVFLVHGHDGEAKHHVARIVQRLTNREPIILDEQASRSRTVVEKFEAHGAAASFAIVLMTPDDVGGPANGDQRPRARQNVVFELGYFIGRLGRERVVALTKGHVEVPSDFAGVVYISLDETDWQQRLGGEMRSINGLDVDLNRLSRI